MSIKTYHKLVRDRIPEIIRSDGKACSVSVLSSDEYIDMLDQKLNEELAEYQESKSLEELADLLEVIRAVAAARGSSMDEIEALRMQKRRTRGGFEKRLLLTQVRDNGQLIYHKSADWSLFRDGFAIPTTQQEYFQNIASLHTEPGECRPITLLIDGIPCPAELRNLPINPTYPNHAPIIQVRYRHTDEAPRIFKRLFEKSYDDLSFEKSTSEPKRHLRTKVDEYFDMYSTEDPMTFRIECHTFASET